MKIRKGTNRGGLIVSILFLSFFGLGDLVAPVGTAKATVVDMTALNQFLPREIRVEAGTTVQWANSDNIMPHTVTDDPANPISGGPNSDIEYPFGIPPGLVYSWTVPDTAVPGTTWYYHCRFHGSPGNGQSLGVGMTGLITVKASSVQVGAAAGLVQASLPADQVVELMVNSTNTHGDTPVYQWIVLTAVIDGNPLPLFLLTGSAISEINEEVLLNLPAYTYSFDIGGVTAFASLPMSALGLDAGDIFIYGYAYMNQSAVIVIDNIVVISIL